MQVAGDHVRAGPGPAAHGAELAGTAPAAQPGGVTQAGEQRRGAVDVDQPLLAHIAAGYGQEAARVNLAAMGDEDEPIAGADLQRWAASAAWPVEQAQLVELLPQPPVQRPEARHLGGRDTAPGQDSTLQTHSPEMMRLGGLDRNRLTEVVQDVEDVLGVGGVERGQDTGLGDP